MKSFLEAMGLNTSCLWEKWSPPSFQEIFTAPLNSWSSRRLANCSVNVLMLSTSDPGGGSCRAMVSDVSIVK